MAEQNPALRTLIFVNGAMGDVLVLSRAMVLLTCDLRGVVLGGPHGQVPWWLPPMFDTFGDGTTWLSPPMSDTFGDGHNPVFNPTLTHVHLRLLEGLDVGVGCAFVRYCVGPVAVRK